MSVLVAAAPQTQFIPITIANGAALTAAFDCGINRLFQILMPATWTTANLTFKGSIDGTTFYDLYDDSGTEITAVAAASRFITFRDPTIFAGLQYIQIRSGTTATPVNQAGDRTLTMILRTI